MMIFAQNEYLVYITAVVVLILILVLFYSFYRYYILKVYFSKIVNIRAYRRRYIATALLIIVICTLFLIVLLRPQWGFHLREKHNRGIDLLVALDISRSMDSQDIAPSRLHRAKNAIRYLAESLPGRIGLVIFAGESFLQCPLTTDKGAFAMYLEYTDTTAISLQGTDLGSAMIEADRVFEKKRINKKVLLLISDGEDHEGNVDSALEQLSEHEVTVYTAGLGSKLGELVPVVNEDDAGIYLKDTSGALVKSKVNRSILKRIAASTGGKYIDISSSFSGITSIIEILKDEIGDSQGTRFVRQPDDRFHYFAFALIVFLIIEMLVHIEWRRK